LNHTKELLEGRVAQDYSELLASAPSLDAAAQKKAITGKGCSVPKVCPKEKASTGKGCSVPKVCPGKSADAFQPGVPAWSRPPAQPLA